MSERTAIFATFLEECLGFKVEVISPYQNRYKIWKHPNYVGELADLDVQMLYNYFMRTECGEGLTQADVRIRSNFILARCAHWMMGSWLGPGWL